MQALHLQGQDNLATLIIPASALYLGLLGLTSAISVPDIHLSMV